VKLRRSGDVRRHPLKWSIRVAVATALGLLSLFVTLHRVSGHAPAANVVKIQAGADIPTIVSSNPAGTTFLIYPGLYRLQTPIRALDGDRFIGQTACAPPTTSCPAILSGSELLTSFQYDGTHYYVTGQTQQGEVSIPSSDCEPDVGYPTAYPGCIYPEDLFFDGVPLVHVIALSDVVSGTWYFDYTNHIIYFYDNPAGHTVETSVVPSAFALGPANNVTIQNLTVEEFAVPISKGAIGGAANDGSQTTGANWVVRNNEISLNHGAGVTINFGWRILNNYIHTNGDLGIGGGALNQTSTRSGVLIEGNELAYNNYAHVAPKFGAGGAKVSGTDGLVFRGNYSHNNEGSGFHADGGNYNILYDSNTSADNTEQGIFHEISYSATVRNNSLLRNGYIHANWTDWLYGANLLSSSSQNLDAYCNTVEVSAQGGNGIDIIGQNREISSGNHFHHNTVTFDGTSGVTGAARDSLIQLNFFSFNRFNYNTYHLVSLDQDVFFFDDHSNSFAQFQAGGQEAGGSADTNYTATVPTVAISSPSDGATVSGTVPVQGTSSGNLSKVQLLVDWKPLETVSTSPFNFSWDTSGVKAGPHTVAAMAYTTEGTSACYAVSLQVQ